MYKRIIAAFIIAIFVGEVSAQSIYNTAFHHFTTDPMANIYGWQGSQLNKYTSEGKFLQTFGIPSYGNIAHVDADNAVKTLVFYQEAGKLVLLNNQLAPIGNELDLFEHDMTSITLAALFGNNQIVLFDEPNQDLYITDLNLNVVTKTHCSFPEEIAPFFLQSESDHCIMLVDSLKGIFFFDRFGTFDRRLSIPGILSAQLYGDNLIYLKDNTLYQYNRKKLEQTHTSPSFIPNSKEIRIAGTWRFILDQDGTLHTIQQ